MNNISKYDRLVRETFQSIIKANNLVSESNRPVPKSKIVFTFLPVRNIFTEASDKNAKMLIKISNFS